MSEGRGTPVDPAGLPADWVQPHDVPCPTCGYNLRMLHWARCPECGSVYRWQQLLHICCPRCNEPLYEVDGELCPRCRLELKWPALLDRAAVYDRRLYEYSNHPVRAAARTCFAVLNPWSFWRRLPLESPPVVGRLRWLRRMAFAVGILGAVLLSTPNGVGVLRPPWAGRNLAGLVLALAVPAVTAAALPRFTPTLARFRVRDDQLLRCLAYSSIGPLWVGVVFALAFAVGWCCSTWSVGGGSVFFFMPDYLAYRAARYWWAPSSYFKDTLFVFNLALVVAWALLGLAWWWVFLYVGLRRYLRLDRTNAVALFLSTQLIAGGVLWILLLKLGIGSQAIGRLQLWLAEVVRGVFGDR